MFFDVLLVLALILKAAEASTNEDTYWSIGSLFGIVFGALAICVLLVIVALTCLKHYKLWVQLKRDKILTTNVVQETAHDPNQDIQPSSCAGESQFPSSFTLQMRSQKHSSTAIYPPLDSFVYQNSMTTAPAVFRCQADPLTIPHIGTSGAVLASAPVEPTPQEDLSRAGLFQRLFRPKPQVGIGHSLHSSLDSAIRLSLTPSDFSRTSRISVAVRNAVRHLRSNIPFGTGSGNSDDTVVLEDGAAAALPTRDSASGSQTRMFKQRKSKKISGIGSGSSRIGWKGKVSAAEDLGQYNIEVTDLGEAESTADNDHFLYSLESAVFTTATEEVSTLNGRAPTGSFDGTSTALSKSREGNAGEVGQPSPSFPSLPPGLPVIGFAFRGFEDEDNVSGVTTQEISIPEESQHLHRPVSEYGTVLAYGTAPEPADDPLTFNRLEAIVPDGATPAQQSTGIRRRSRLVHEHQHLAQHHTPAGSENDLYTSANSASAMFASSRSRSHEDLPRRQSVSDNRIEIHPPSEHRGSAGVVEHWMIASDEYLLISPGGESRSRSQGGDQPLRSLSSSDLPRKAH